MGLGASALLRYLRLTRCYFLTERDTKHLKFLLIFVDLNRNGQCYFCHMYNILFAGMSV